MGAIFYFLYRFLSSDARRAANIIGRKLGVKPALVADFIMNMRRDSNRALGKVSRQQFYCQMVVSANDDAELICPIKVFYIYQVLKSDHGGNVSWWRNKLARAGFESKISESEQEVFCSFFDVDWREFKDWVEVHNAVP